MLRRNLSPSDCKRGQWLQFSFVIVMVLAIAIVMLVLTQFQSEINTMVQDTDMSNESKVVMQAQSDSTGNVFDAGLMIVLVFMWLLCLGLAYNSGSSPLLFVVALVIIFAMGFTGMILSNAWEDVSSDTGFSTALADMPMTGWVLDHYLIYVIIVGFTTLLTAFSTRGGF